MLILGHPDQPQPEQRCPRRVEAGGSLVFQQALESLVSLPLPDVGPVLPLHVHPYVAVHYLQRAVQALPVVGGPQRGVRRDRLPPGVRQGVAVERPVDGKGVLGDVGIRVAVVQAMEQHALLQG